MQGLEAGMSTATHAPGPQPRSRAPGPTVCIRTHGGPLGLRVPSPPPAKAVTGLQEAGAEGDIEGQSQGS